MIKNVGPNKGGKYKQNFFTPKNAEKYHGDLEKIIFRSSWESRFMVWCDLNPDVKKWSSEPIGIPYISPLDKKYHTYYVDFWVLIEKNGIKQQYLVEVKPNSQTKPPSPKLCATVNEGAATAAQLKRYNRELRTYIINQTKFKFATRYAASRGMIFKVADESFLF
jgi:hypothetical protein